MKPKVPTLTRKDIAHYIAEHNDVKSCEVDCWVDAVLEAIRELLMSADPEVRLELRDFGVFEVKMTKAKPRARNPKTGDRLYVPSRRKTHFKPSKYLKNFLNEPLTKDQEEILLHRDDLKQQPETEQSVAQKDYAHTEAASGHEVHEVEEHVLG